MKEKLDLPQSLLYESRFKQVQGYSYNESLENLRTQLKAKQKEHKRLRELERQRQKELNAYRGRCMRVVYWLWQHSFAKLGEEWAFLAVLGIFVAIISYIIDKGVLKCGQTKMWLYSELATNGFSKWIAWICLPICLVLFDVGFTKLVAPQAVGSGIPQIKTMLRGVVLKEYLTYRVLIAKWVGIASTLGSGMPLGKEGPLIHMSSIIVTKMLKAVGSFKSVYQTESKTIEMIGAAWAVGVACTFNAPIGGVLFSIEISTAYFAVRNYWRGFFAAVWAATTYRLLSVWIDGAATITVVFKSSFYVDFPYDPQELFAFAILGLICGFGGSFYVWCKQRFGKWLNKNKTVTRMKSLSIFLYPFCVVIVYATVTFPMGIGRFIAADLSPRDQVVTLFSNFTWTNRNLTLQEYNVISHWTTTYSGIYTNLVCYIAYQFIFSILTSSIPIPCGAFIPNFRTGAAIGRITGELMHNWFPLGVRYKGAMAQIMPGAYAMVGAAAYSGAVTQTMSVCVILFEMTSQITHVIPVLIAVLIANGVARLLVPSIYDIVIYAKKLPYLPDLLPHSSAIYRFFVEDFMITDVKCIYWGMPFSELNTLLKENPKLRHFPLVDNPESMILLGSIPRQELAQLLMNHVGHQRRLQYLPESKEPDEETVLRSPQELMKRKARDQIMDKYVVKKKLDWSFRTPTPSPKKPPRKHQKALRICDLSEEEQAIWEEEELKKQTDFSMCHVDPAPFQLVERTSLLKVHSLFSMVAINFAYVTSFGKLVGVVGLKELRKAIEDANNGILPKEEEESNQLLPQNC